MLETLSIVASIFGLIGIGYGVARIHLLAPSVGQGLTDFVFTVAIPLLLFQTLATADLHGLSPWRIWIAYFIPFALVWMMAHVMIRRIFGRDVRAGIVAGGSAAYSNAVLIGIPLMQAAFGEPGTIFLIVIVVVHLPVMMLLSSLLHEWTLQSEGAAEEAIRRESLLRLARALIMHPILLGILVAMVWRVAGLPIPPLARTIIEPLGKSAGPLALFACGMALVNYGVARQIAAAASIAALKLILMPGLVFAMAHLAGLPPIGIAVVTLTAACPTGINAFLVASRLGTGQALASNAVLISTAAGVVTVMLWLIVLRATLVI